MCPACKTTVSPSGVDSTSLIFCGIHGLRGFPRRRFLPGIRGLVISHPIVLARQWTTWQQLIFVLLFMASVATVQTCPQLSGTLFAFLFLFPFNCWKIKLWNVSVLELSFISKFPGSEWHLAEGFVVWPKADFSYPAIFQTPVWPSH